MFQPQKFGSESFRPFGPAASLPGPPSATDLDPLAQPGLAVFVERLGPPAASPSSAPVPAPPAVILLHPSATPSTCWFTGWIRETTRPCEYLTGEDAEGL